MGGKRTSLHLERSYEFLSRHFIDSCLATSHGSTNWDCAPRERRTSTYGAGVAPVAGNSGAAVVSLLGGVGRCGADIGSIRKERKN